MPSDKGVLRRSAQIDGSEEDPVALEMLKALASEPRLAILRFLGDRLVSVHEIATALDMPPSTAAMHVGVLEEAGLIRCDLRPATRGLRKVCVRTYDEVVVTLPRRDRTMRRVFEQSMPVGAYSDAAVEPTCGLAGLTGLIGFIDDPSTFYEPDRVNAQLVWFRSGYVEYRFPNRVPGSSAITSLTVSMELCSEAPLHDLDWPSDISMWINGVHLGAWTCPGDFGGTRGHLTPSWWDERDTQYGLFKRWQVGDDGTTIDGVALSGVVLGDLALQPSQSVVIRIGIAADARNVGGVNLFGRGFGNYPQDIVLRIDYEMATPTQDREGH